MTRQWLRTPSFLLLIVLAVPLSAGCGLATRQADGVLGQLELTTNAANNMAVAIAGRLNLPEGAAVGPASGPEFEPGRLYVADAGNNRVLSWPSASAFANGEPADRVLGQADLMGMLPNEGGPGPTRTSLKAPGGVAVDGFGNVYVADTGNHRVLVYKSPVTTHQAADRVYGQFTFTDGAVNGAGREFGLSGPMGVALGADGLYVADTGNNRVLAYKSPQHNLPFLVIGQTDFTGHDANEGRLTPSATSLGAPSGLAGSTSGDLWVADGLNHRVLRFSAPLSNHKAADLVLGQPDFTSKQTNADNQATGATLRFPWGVALDPGGNLYVSDKGNSRVLRFLPPFSNQMTASLILGQPDPSQTTANNGGVSGRSLNQPFGVAVNDINGGLIVADTNSRVLKYGYFHIAGDNLPDTVYAGVNGCPGFQKTGRDTFCRPLGVTMDKNGRLFVVDRDGNRVLSWASLAEFDSGWLPDAVIGAPDFDKPAFFGVSERSLSLPTAVATDPAGNLWVADTGNNRVLRFPGPILANTKGPAADLVIGQTKFTGNLPNLGGAVSSGGLDQPQGVATDDTGRVYVSDTNNNRVLVFRVEVGPLADIVIGQGQFNFTAKERNAGANVPNASGFDMPRGLAVGPGCDLYVADRNNSRVMVFEGACSNLYKGGPAHWVLGQTDMINQAKENQGRQQPDATTLALPGDIAVDLARQLVYVTDPNNSRVLQYRLPLVRNGQAATRVFGQQDFKSFGATYGWLGGIAMPGQGCIILGGVVVDKLGNLLVVDACGFSIRKYDVPAQ